MESSRALALLETLARDIDRLLETQQRLLAVMECATSCKSFIDEHGRAVAQYRYDGPSDARP